MPRKSFDAPSESHVNTGSLAEYRALNAKFMENLATLHPELLLQSDATQALHVRREQNGEITIETQPGVRTTWKNAIRSGLIPMPYFRDNPFRR